MPPRERTRPVYTPGDGPPPVQRPSEEIFEVIGETGIFALLADFYGRLEATPLRGMFPDDMRAASERSAAFFVQILGGPPMFNERYGPPRMRARHLPFEIDAEARRIWLATFHATLDDAPVRHGFPKEHLPVFRAFLDGFSTWMVNVAPE